MDQTTLILTADPEFAAMALAELQSADPQAESIARLAPGVHLLRLSRTFFDLAAHWQRNKPIFVRHICPAQIQIRLSQDPAAALAQLVDCIDAEYLALLEADFSFSVQTRLFGPVGLKPFDVNQALAGELTKTGAPLDVRAPQQILSVVIAGEAEERDRPDDRDSAPVAYLGLSLAVHNLSDWAGGMRRFARTKEQVSRSEFKLLEALEAFDLPLTPHGVALDLGAAPGGWTRILREAKQYVTAVDPGALDPRVEADKGVRHLRMTAEEYLADEPDRFDLIVNDMRMDARDSARLMVAYARQLYRHGMVLMTFKLPETNRERVLDHAFNLLHSAYTVEGARQLFHNRSEITVLLRLRAGRVPEEGGKNA